MLTRPKLEDEVAGLQSANKLLQAKLIKGQHRETAYKKLIDIERALNNILKISQQHLPLHKSLNQVLKIILGIPWLTLEKKGCVFITEPHRPQQLQMVASCNIDQASLMNCNKVEFGDCLCGLATMSGEAIFENCVSDEHCPQSQGMEPHGHCVIPLVTGDRVIGVLNLYVKPDHIFKRRETRFLKSVAGVMSGMISAKQYEQRLSQMSYQDELTRLPNRRSFMLQLERTIKRAERSGEKFALFFLDLDRFKPVNDTWGHDTGDLILKAVAERLVSILRGIDMVARYGGDEFTIITELISSLVEVKDLGERLIAEIGRPYRIGDNEIQIGVSLGLSMFPADGDNVEALLKRADYEMYLAKFGKGPKSNFRLGTA